ncbi:hypothetical protein ACWD25_48885 [Streptomyces sp. NPDC002920]
MRLAEASCTEACRGALYVTMQRDGDYVLWDEWRNPDEDDMAGADRCTAAGERPAKEE